MKEITRHYVQMEHMNHHGSLYAGVLTDWMTESAFLGISKAIGRKDNIVMCAVQDFKFINPVKLGTIIEFMYEIIKTGSSSITVMVEALDMFDTSLKYAVCQVTFVNTGEDGKSLPHGLTINDFA